MPDKPKQNSDINIGKIKGNVIISQNQQGGITSNENTQSVLPQKKSLLKRWGLWAALIVSLITILTYLGIKPNDKTLNNSSSQNKDSSEQKKLIRPDTVKSFKDTANLKQPIKRKKMFDKKKDEITKPISIGNVTGDVIISQNQHGGITAHTVNITSEKYHELLGNSENQVFQNLKKLMSDVPNHPELQIEVESGNSIRNKVALKLESILQQFNAGVYPKGNTFIGIRPDYPITIILNPVNKHYTNELLIALKPYIDSEYNFEYRENFPNEVVKFYINGNPTFDNLGHVTIN